MDVENKVSVDVPTVFVRVVISRKATATLLTHNTVTSTERGVSNIVNDVSTNLNIPPVLNIYGFLKKVIDDIVCDKNIFGIFYLKTDTSTC